MKRSLFLPALILTLFATGGIVLITITDVLTQERRTLEERAALTRLIRAVAPNVPGGAYRWQAYTPEAQALGRADGIRRVYVLTNDAAAISHALEIVAPDGYNGPLQLLLGLDDQRRVSGVRVIRHRETPGLGDRVKIDKSDWLLGFNGLSAAAEERRWELKKHAGDFDNLTGATVTAKAVLNAVRDNLLYLRDHPQLLNERSD